MKTSEIIDGLEDLIQDRESFATPANNKFYGEDNPFHYDKEVLQAAIDKLHRAEPPKSDTKTSELIEELRNYGLSDGSSLGRHIGIMDEAADRLEELNRCAEPENKPLQQLKVENAQLRAVITQSDPNFFKRKCRVCGCDWNHPCNGHDYWVEDDLCSACADRKPEGSETP